MNIGTGVVIGRFQTPSLTPGHIHLLNYTEANSRKLVVVIGESPTRFTSRHPLPFELRKDLIKSLYPHADVLKLDDCESDKTWSANLDKLLQGYKNITLFGGRYSFIKSYSGVNSTMCIPLHDSLSATEVRANIKPYSNPVFLRGMIHATNSKFPTTYPTVDMIVTMGPGWMILLGRKYNSTNWRLPGGFVDPTDISLEEAAKRELHEEVPNLKFTYPKYLGSAKINDWRYRGTTDGIMTSLFKCQALDTGANPLKGGDDLEEVQWFSLIKAKEIIIDIHKPLLKIYECGRI